MTGRVCIVDGTPYYSPNSQRALTTLGSNGPEDYAFTLGISTADDYQHPKWWTAQAEWLACIPTKPINYSGVLVESLAYVPHKLSIADPHGFVLPHRVISQWLAIENCLDQVVEILAKENGFNFTRPFAPSSFMYHKGYNTDQRTRDLATKARDWFSIWLGLLYWQIHRIPDEAHHEGLTPAKWVIQIATARKLSQALLDCLRTAPLLQRYWCIPRAGVILHYPAKPSQPSPKYFMDINIPVWYRWSPTAGSLFPAPSAEELQLASTWIAREPRFPSTDHRPLIAFADLLPPRSNLAPIDDPIQPWEPFSDPYSPQPLSEFIPTDNITQPEASDNRMVEQAASMPSLDQYAYISKGGTLRMKSTKSGQSVWEPFFQERATIIAKRIAKETSRVRQIRENRERNPPTTNALVYVWDWDFDDPTKFTRTLVRKDERKETLAEYSSQQKRYDAVFNEWHCCIEWGEDKEDSDNEDDHEAGERGPEMEEPVVVSRHNEDEPETLAGIPWQEVAEVEQLGDLAPVSTYATDSDEFIADHLRCATLEILITHFGFTVPTGLKDEDAVVGPVNGRSLIHTLAITWTPLESPFFCTPLGQRCLNFLSCFSGKIHTLPCDQEWDMTGSNPRTLLKSWRLKCLRVVANTDEQMYMFDLGSQSTMPWKIAVCTATAALSICRMDSAMTEKDIVLELVLAGTRFRTLQAATTLKFIDADMSHPVVHVPLRLLDHKFTRLDYEFYSQQCQVILKQPRGRAALLRGGFVHRIALNTIGKNDALSGPTGKYRDGSPMYSTMDGEGVEFLDDELSQSERDVICGLYFSYSGQGEDMRKVSWFPLTHIYEKSGEDLGRWSNRMADLYDRQVACTLGSIQDEKMGFPWTPTVWRQRLRGAPEGRRAMKTLEERSREFINTFGPPSAHR